MIYEGSGKTDVQLLRADTTRGKRLVCHDPFARIGHHQNQQFQIRTNTIMRIAGLLSRTRTFPPRTTASLSALAVAACILAPTHSRADDVAEGQRIWTVQAQCQECHGWAGDGERTIIHSEGKAPSLRLTQLTRDEIRMTIQCGRPGTPMPHFDRFAYTDKRCYDMTAEDLGDKVPNRGAVTLQSYQIDALADYIAEKIKGAGPVTRAQCLDFFKSEAGSRCERYPEH